MKIAPWSCYPMVKRKKNKPESLPLLRKINWEQLLKQIRFDGKWLQKFISQKHSLRGYYSMACGKMRAWTKKEDMGRGNSTFGPGDIPGWQDDNSAGSLKSSQRRTAQQDEESWTQSSGRVDGRDGVRCLENFWDHNKDKPHQTHEKAIRNTRKKVFKKVLMQIRTNSKVTRMQNNWWRLRRNPLILVLDTSSFDWPRNPDSRPQCANLKSNPDT